MTNNEIRGVLNIIWKMFLYTFMYTFEIKILTNSRWKEIYFENRRVTCRALDLFLWKKIFAISRGEKTGGTSSDGCSSHFRICKREDLRVWKSEMSPTWTLHIRWIQQRRFLPLHASSLLGKISIGSACLLCRLSWARYSYGDYA